MYILKCVCTEAVLSRGQGSGHPKYMLCKGVFCLSLFVVSPCALSLLLDGAIQSCLLRYLLYLYCMCVVIFALFAAMVGRAGGGEAPRTGWWSVSRCTLFPISICDMNIVFFIGVGGGVAGEHFAFCYQMPR